MNPDFWTRFDRLLNTNEIVIDRPKDSSHPRYPDLIYPLNYGYLKGISGGDGHDIDVWQGSKPSMLFKSKRTHQYTGHTPLC